jgi:DNA primase
MVGAVRARRRRRCRAVAMMQTTKRRGPRGGTRGTSGWKVGPVPPRNLDASEQARKALSDPRSVCDALGLLRGATRQPHGLVVCCPWHGDRHPSCSIRQVDGVVVAHCFSCGARGDVFALVAQVRGLDVRRDFARVLDEACALARVAPPPREVEVEVDEPPPDERTFGLLAASLLEACPIARQPDVLAYLERRRIASHARHWGALPSDARELANVRAHLIARHGREAWFASGLARGEGWAWAAHRLVIPWRSPGVDGAVVALQRRAIVEVDGPRYVFGRGRVPVAPYGVEEAVEEVGDGVEVWFVEGAIDAVALRILASRRGAQLAPLGLPGVASWGRHVAAVTGLVEGRVAVVGVDGDRAGEAQVRELARALYRAGADRVRRARARGGDWADALEEAAS